MTSSRSGFKEYWVEMLAVIILLVALLVFTFGEDVLRRPLPSDDRSTANMREVMAGFMATSYAAVIALAGLSLFLVRPILRFNSEILLWLLTVGGIALIAGMKPICEGSNAMGGPSSSLCGLIAIPLGGILTLLGTVATVRSLQLPTEEQPKA